MTIQLQQIKRLIAGLLALLLATPLAQAKPSLSQTMTQQTANTPSGAEQATQATAPPTNANKPETSATNAQPSQAPQTSTSNAPVAAPQSNAAQQPSQNQQPVGTAVAPAQRTLGIAASRPAGAAIAPAKQRHARSFFIQVGVVVGACVALGTVVALSKSSPSQPH